jgi:hypothetical protein
VLRKDQPWRAGKAIHAWQEEQVQSWAYVRSNVADIFSLYFSNCGKWDQFRFAYLWRKYPVFSLWVEIKFKINMLSIFIYCYS